MNNSVELIGYYGSDETIALAAWTSTSRKLTPEKKDRIPQMVKTLWADGHKTPFERGIVHFLVTCDIASHIHLIKHRHIGTNGESARYKELKEDKFYIPRDWEDQRLSRETQAILGDSVNMWSQKLEEYTELGNKIYHECLKDLTITLGRKRAKESARYFKTYNSQIETDVIMNMSSFANFLYLRKADKAQDEIHFIAKEMLRQVKTIENQPFKATIEAFGY